MANQIGKDFILAGKAIFTVANPKGERYTYQITRKDPREGDRYQKPTYFVALLTGPNNEADYTYMGVLSAATGTVILTKASKFKPETTAVKVAQWAIALMLKGLAVPTGYAIHHEGRCGRCGRTLTVPESILTGLGPECSAKMGLGQAAAPVQVPMELGAEWKEETEANTNAENEGAVL